jgi:ABC-type branched-subunit amino acid transport system ATPase component
MIVGADLPVEILQMDEKSIKMYREKLLEGTERAHNIRVMVVGHYGVGKTTLTRRLLGAHDVAGIASTNGVDVHRCHVTLETGQWQAIDSTYRHIYI